MTAARDGFSLNAALTCEDHGGDKLERLWRDVPRGPIAAERPSIDGDGPVVYALKRPFRYFRGFVIRRADCSGLDNGVTKNRIKASL